MGSRHSYERELESGPWGALRCRYAIGGREWGWGWRWATTLFWLTWTLRYVVSAEMYGCDPTEVHV